MPSDSFDLDAEIAAHQAHVVEVLQTIFVPLKAVQKVKVPGLVHRYYDRFTGDDKSLVLHHSPLGTSLTILDRFQKDFRDDAQEQITEKYEHLKTTWTSGKYSKAGLPETTPEPLTKRQTAKTADMVVAPLPRKPRKKALEPRGRA